VAVATMVVMGVKAPTAAVDPAAADIGNSPRIIQQRKGTADSICCQPFSIVRQLLAAVGNKSNPAARNSQCGNKSYRVGENGGAPIAPPCRILLLTNSRFLFTDP
jgi:hypothetical protein